MRAPYLVAMALALAACSPGDDDPTGADGGCLVTGDAAADGSHVRVTPANGVCWRRCFSGWYTCDGQIECGTDLRDDANCGACGRACEAADRCVLFDADRDVYRCAQAR